MKYFILLFALFFYETVHAQQKDTVDLMVHGGTIYTVNTNFDTVQAMVIKNGIIISLGNTNDLLKNYYPNKMLDVKGDFVYPGLIDAHCHFVGYATTLQQVDLTQTKSWQEVLERVKAFAAAHPEGWLLGRGWDQNNWADKNYPVNDSLNILFPNRPVCLKRIDGHAVIVNDVALKLAKIKKKTSVEGGEIIRTDKQKATGVLIDNAVDLVGAVITPMHDTVLSKALHKAETQCLSYGLTSVVDCGLDFDMVEQLQAMYNKKELAIRSYVMLSDKPENFKWMQQHGPIENDFLHVRGFKVYADGALGSRGACLLKHYSDRPKWNGFLLSTQAHFDSVAALIYKNKWQMCTHAIGDSSNRVILDIYGKYLQPQDDLRWRIEHAQLVNKNDVAKFGQFKIIPSVQPTHATSDMYWAEDRIGEERIHEAYAFQNLLQQNGWLPLGTDFPVEKINPMMTFYAAVSRKDAAGKPEGGFEMQNALTREQALRGMTIWAAKASFEEDKKGSLEIGKWADFIVMDRDIMQVPEKQIIHAQVKNTYIGGVLRITRIVKD